MFKKHLWKRAQFSAWFLVSLTCNSGILFAAAHPNFTGTWNMDPAHSDFGPVPRPTKITDTIAQNESELVINRNRDGKPSVIRVPLDGSQKGNKMRIGAMNTKGHWETAVLVINFSGERNGTPLKIEERWILSPDKKILKVTRNALGPRGKAVQKLTMLRASVTTP